MGIKSNKRRNVSEQKTNYTIRSDHSNVYQFLLSLTLLPFNFVCVCVSNLFYVISLRLFAITAWLCVASALTLALALIVCCCSVASAIFSTRFVSFRFNFNFIYFSLPLSAKCVIGFLCGRFAHWLAIFLGNLIVCSYVISPIARFYVYLFSYVFTISHTKWNVWAEKKMPFIQGSDQLNVDLSHWNWNANQTNE